MQQDLQLSNKQVKILAQDITISAGLRKAIENNMRDKLYEMNRQLDECFETRKLVSRREDKDTKTEENFEQTTIVCADLSKLIDLILEKRQRIEGESLLIRIGMVESF